MRGVGVRDSSLCRFCVLFLLRQGLNGLIAPFEIWSLLCLMIMSVGCLVAVLMLEKLSLLKSVSLVYVVRELAPICSVVASVGALGWRC